MFIYLFLLGVVSQIKLDWIGLDHDEILSVNVRSMQTSQITVQLCVSRSSRRKATPLACRDVNLERLLLCWSVKPEWCRWLSVTEHSMQFERSPAGCGRVRGRRVLGHDDGLQQRAPLRRSIDYEQVQSQCPLRHSGRSCDTWWPPNRNDHCSPSTANARSIMSYRNTRITAVR